MYTILIIAIIIIGLIILFAYSKRKNLKYKNAVDGFVNTIFSGQVYRPEVTVGSAYGIPSFTSRFETDEEKHHAVSNGLTNRFLDCVQELCSNIRPRGEEFNAELAVEIYSVDDEKRWAQKSAAFHKDKK